MKPPACAAIAIGIDVGNAQAPATRDFRIIRLDPALDSIVSPDAKLETLGEHIQLPDVPGEPRKQVCATNVGFGDPDAKGLYITACNLLFRIRLNNPGVRPGPTPWTAFLGTVLALLRYNPSTFSV